MPADSFTHTASADAPPSQVLTALEVPTTWRGVGLIDEVFDAHESDGRLTSFRWRAAAAGKTWVGTARRAESDANAVAFDIEASEVAGTITVGTDPDGEGTSLTVRIDARSKGLLAAMFWGVIADTLRKGLPDQVEAFADDF